MRRRRTEVWLRHTEVPRRRAAKLCWRTTVRNFRPSISRRHTRKSSRHTANLFRRIGKRCSRMPTKCRHTGRWCRRMGKLSRRTEVSYRCTKERFPRMGRLNGWPSVSLPHTDYSSPRTTKRCRCPAHRLSRTTPVCRRTEKWQIVISLPLIFISAISNGNSPGLSYYSIQKTC